MNPLDQIVLFARIGMYASLASVLVNLIICLAIWRMTSAHAKTSATLTGITDTMRRIADTQKSISEMQRDQVKMQQAVMMQVAVLDAKSGGGSPNAFGADGRG